MEPSLDRKAICFSTQAAFNIPASAAWCRAASKAAASKVRTPRPRRRLGPRHGHQRRAVVGQIYAARVVRTQAEVQQAKRVLSGERHESAR